MASSGVEQFPLPEGCTLRFFEEGDEEEMLNLLDRAFGGWPKKELRVPPIEHLRWKLRGHEAALSSHVVAVLDGRIIAIRSVLGRPMKLDDRLVLARTGVDRAVLPEFQRQRVMTAMELRIPPEWTERFDVILSLRNNWESVSASPGKPYRRTIDVVVRALDVLPPVEPPTGCTLRRVAAFDERTEAFWHEASQPYRLAIARTKKYLNYRYADARAGSYTITIAEGAQRLLGYIITTAGSGVGHIADVLVLPERLDVLETLVADVLRRLQSDGNASVEYWRFAFHPYARVLEKLGFDTSRHTHGLNMQSLDGRDDELAFFADPKAAVHFTAGDTDLV